MTKRVPMEINFTAELYTLKDWLLLPIPDQESSRLPSRGQVSVNMTIDGSDGISTVLEPDGRGSHWVRIGDKVQQQLAVGPGSRVAVQIRTSPTWPEPVVPSDLGVALKSASEKVKSKWQNITPMARWEWVRWIGATKSSQTRAVRIEKTISKLEGSHRRPCCFNLAACTEPYVAKGGQLIESAE